MQLLLAFFFVTFLVSIAGLEWVGLHPVAPWSLVVVLLLTVPFAYGVSVGASRLGHSIGSWKYGAPLYSVFVGFGLLWVYQPETQAFRVVVLLLFSALMARLIGGPRNGFASTFLMGLLALGLCQAAVSYLNYVALVGATNRLHDPVLRALDVQMYRAVYGRAVEYTGIFPLVTSGIGFATFERAYRILFAEMAVVVFALVDDVDRLRSYLLRMFGCYVSALGMFVAWPAVGPCLYYPESFRSGYEATTTALWMSSSYIEFAAIRDHLQPITGFGYFVALPSLHTAMALLCQLSLRRSRILFWMFFPINALIIASTVVLGYHYALDVPAGIALVAIIFVFTGGRLSRRRSVVPGAEIARVA